MTDVLLCIMLTKPNESSYTQTTIVTKIVTLSWALIMLPNYLLGVAQMCDSKALLKRYTKTPLRKALF